MTEDETIAKLLAKGLSPVDVADLLDIDLEYVASIPAPRQRPTTDAAQLTTAMSQYAQRAFEEGMQLLDEGTPSIKLRLIQGAMGHTLRFLSSQSPQELEDIKDELSVVLRQHSTDDSDPNSIYASDEYADPIYYDPSSLETDSVVEQADDSDQVSDHRTNKIRR